MKKIIDCLKRNEIIVIIFLLIIIAGYWLYNNNDKRIVLKDYKYTIGKMVEYYRVGEEGVSYLQYEYAIKNTIYYRKICPTRNGEYDYCANNFEQCKDKKFWVIYSRKNPSKSLIDLTNEIQGVENPEKPKTVDNFE